MTDAQVGSAEAGSPATGNGNGDQGSKAGTTDPFTGLETGSRQWVEKSGAKDVATLVKNAMNAESLIGRSVQIPADDAKPEDVDKFLSKATEKYRPTDANGYEFKLPEGIPAEMPYSAEFANQFKQWAFEAGLPATRAQFLHDKWVGMQAETFAKSNEAMAAKVAGATDALEKAWGKADSDGFQKGKIAAERTIREAGLEAALKETGLLGPGNLVLHPELAVFLAKAVSLYTEDTHETGGSGSVGDNPFKDGPGKGNMTEQMKAIKADRPRAIQMIRSAGHDPKGWGLTE